MHSVESPTAPAVPRIWKFTIDGKAFNIYGKRPSRITPRPPAAQCLHCRTDKPVSQVGNRCEGCNDFVTMKPNVDGINAAYVLQRYPRIVAHMICSSLGYFTPSSAAACVANAIKGEKNFCEMVAHCFKGDAQACVRHAISHRIAHRGPMAEYHQALPIVAAAVAGLGEPHFASWF